GTTVSEPTPESYSDARSLVRLLIADVDPANPILTDAQVDGYLALRGVTTPTSSVAPSLCYQAAADALVAIAASEVLVSKVIRTQDLSTNGAQVAAELRAQAGVYRQRAQEEDDDANFS